MHSIKKGIAALLPDKVKGEIRSKKIKNHYIREMRKAIKTNPNELCFIFGIAIHGNLGDQAIIKAEYEFMKDYFPEKTIVEMPAHMFELGEEKLKKVIGKNTIYIHGGGFLGTLWSGGEETLRDLIRMFPNNKIVVFPQTIYFEDSEYGRTELEKSKKIYNSHKKLYICAREKISYDMLKQDFENVHSILTPDIVTYLPQQMMDRKEERKGIVVCLRNDKEGVLDEKMKKNIINLLEKYDNDIRITDTVYHVDITDKDREYYLNKKFTEFSNAKLVVTDRLHGMVFAAITGTPCIVMSNVNHKVKGVYEWIKYLNYISFIEDMSELEMNVERMLKISEGRYDNSVLKEYFDNIADVIRK